MLIISDSEVRELLKMQDCIDLLKTLFDDQLDPKTQLMIRQRLPLPSGSLQVMGGVVPYSRAAGLKTYISIPGSKSAQMVIVLFGTESAEPLAIISANALGQIRTGAVSGLATDYMAKSDAKTVSVIGSGFQAFTQMEAVCKVRKINKAFVYSRNHNVSTSQNLFRSNIIVNLCQWVLIDYRHYMTGTRRSVRLDAATTCYDQARLSTIASKVTPPVIRSG